MEAYEVIRDAIVEGDFLPNMRLTEEFLAEKLNVSRTPIRDAIKRLEAEGMVTPLKRGVVVRSFTANDIQEIYDLRALLEGHAAAKASLAHTEPDIERMSEAIALHERSIEPFTNSRQYVKTLMQYNQAFHDAIFQSAQNNHLEIMISKVVVLPLVFRSFYWYTHKDIVSSLTEHRLIFKAIVEKDPDWARTAMASHIYKGRDHVLSHIADLS